MNNSSVDLEWIGLRAVGANALEVMKWFRILGQENEHPKLVDKNTTKKTLIVLDSLAPLNDKPGAYFNSELNTVEVIWNNHAKLQIASLLSTDSSIQTQVAFTASALANVLRHLVEGVGYPE